MIETQPKNLRTQITKCYLVQVIDDDGDEVACEYAFVNTQKEAARIASRLKRDLLTNG